MKYTRPDYYKDFVCIATNCPDTCCANWQIVIDKKSLNRFKETKGPFGNRIHNSIDWENGVFKQYDRQCSFLNEDKLCDMYVETGGPDVMCQICKTYPRHREDFHSHTDIMLSMSCPEVARIILTSEKKAAFTTTSRVKGGKVSKKCAHSQELYMQLRDARSVMYDILQNRELPIQVRMSYVLAMANDIQIRMDQNRISDISEILTNYTQKERQKYLISKILKNETKSDEVMSLRKVAFKQMLQLYHLNPNWKRNIEESYESLYSMENSDYSKQKKAFKVYMNTQKEGINFAIQCEQLMVYFLFHYYCGAAYDEQEFAKVKYAVVSTLLIEELLFALWIENNSVITDNDVIDIAYQFSREVEHLDDNYLKFEKALIEKKEFTLANLLINVMGTEQ